jgi:hypothetical protein
MDHGFNEPVSKPTLFGFVGNGVMKHLNCCVPHIRGDKSQVAAIR